MRGTRIITKLSDIYWQKELKQAINPSGFFLIKMVLLSTTVIMKSECVYILVQCLYFTQGSKWELLKYLFYKHGLNS